MNTGAACTAATFTESLPPSTCLAIALTSR
jgi:hypothetical protein